jgi:hypothetical protein
MSESTGNWQVATVSLNGRAPEQVDSSNHYSLTGLAVANPARRSGFCRAPEITDHELERTLVWLVLCGGGRILG